MTNPANSITSADAWRSASQAARLEHAEALKLPSGATILAARPEPLEWILAGRLPQRLLGLALESRTAPEAGAGRDLSREEILELARFATHLVKATVLEPRLGEGPGEISPEEIPMQDRVFIFEWACRAWSEDASEASQVNGSWPSGESQPPAGAFQRQEDLSIPKPGIERFHQK